MQVHALLQPYGIKIPYDTPPRNGADLDGGWAFEDALMGGRLEGLWVTDDEPAPVDVTPGEFMGMDLGTIDRTVTTNVRQTVKVKLPPPPSSHTPADRHRARHSTTWQLRRATKRSTKSVRAGSQSSSAVGLWHS